VQDGHGSLSAAVTQETTLPCFSRRYMQSKISLGVTKARRAKELQVNNGLWLWCLFSKQLEAELRQVMLLAE
jgi:hypothetical protein